MDPQTAVAFLESWGYPLLGLLLVATGFGSPIPEDLLLLAAGYLIGSDVFAWSLALPMAYSGVVGSDCILYWLGTRIRTHSARWTSRVVRFDRLERFSSWFRHGHIVVFVARLVPGTRAVVFVSAGLRGIPFRRFLLFDALGAAIWVPLLLFVGAHIGEEIGGVERLFTDVARLVWWAALLAMLLVVAWRYLRTEESKL